MTKVMQPSSPTRGAETRLDLATVANIAEIASAVGMAAKYLGGKFGGPGPQDPRPPAAG